MGFGGDEQIQGVRSCRVPEELWTKFYNIVQEAVTKTIPRKKKWKKAKRLTEETSQIAEERAEVKGKAEKERLNAEFQRTTVRDKKAFLNKQGKEIENNNTMGKTRDLLRKLEISREYIMQAQTQ